MTDKYEEFKEWFLGISDCDIPRKTELEEIHHSMMNWINPVYARTEYDRKRIFEKFEEEQEEKEREKEIKKIIRESISRVPLEPTIRLTNPEIWCSDRLANTLYDRLKEEDLIK